MTTPQNHSFTTQIVHADRLGGAEQGAIHKPIHTSVQYGYEKVEDLIAVFQGTAKGGFNYARQGTPTTAALETKITQMERGHGSIVFSTGMAGICAVFLTLLKAGDHLVASQFVFGNTNSVFGTLADLGIEVTTVDVTDAANVAAALRPNTRMVFVETIANPGTQIPDLEGIGALCKAHGALYVVDNTVASPYLFRAATVGAGLVVNSLTKSIGGQGDALGGAITDTGLYDWSGYPNIFAAYRKGDAKGWGLQQLRKRACATWAVRCRPTPPTSWPWARRPCRCAWTAPVPRPWRWHSGWRRIRPSRACCTPCCPRTRSTPLHASTSRRARGCCRSSCATPTSACPCATVCSCPLRPRGWPTRAR